MSKILQSLPLTVLAGIVLTVIMVGATTYLEDRNLSGAERAVSDLQKKMN